MFELKPDGLTESRQGYLFTYVQIAFNQLRRFTNLQHPESNPPGFRQYTIVEECKAETLECKILAVLATSLFLEAYMYDYCARKESGTYTSKYLEKLDPVAKWVIIPRLIVPPGLNRDDYSFERLRKLYKLRNELVHHKTKEGDDYTNPPEFSDDLEPQHCIKLICDLLSQLNELDPSDDFGKFILNHIASWFKYAAKDKNLYPILWEA
jgi:hypothetical protein